MSKAKKTLNIIVNIVLVLYLIFALVVCAFVISTKASGGIPSLFGYSVFKIKTDSMKDTLNVGDLIISKRLESDDVLELKENDVITYYFVASENEDGSVVKEIRTHRIVSVLPDDPDYGIAFYTKGDNADGVDEKVPATDVIAKYTDHKLPKFLGFLDNSDRAPGERNNAILFVLVIPLALFFLYALYRFVRAILESKYNKKAAGEAPAAELSDEEKKRIAEEYLRSQNEAGKAEEAVETVEETATEAVAEASETAGESLEEAGEAAESAVDEAAEAAADDITEE